MRVVLPLRRDWMLRLRRVLLVAFGLVAAGCASTRDLIPVRLIAFNDLHGHLEAGNNALTVPDPRDLSKQATLRAGGVAYLASAVRRLRAEQPASVLISSGDLTGASPLISALARDEPTIEVMNALGLDLNAVGNHEFDRGVAELQRLIAGGCAATPRGMTASCAGPTLRYDGARFTFIAANVADTNGRTLLPPYVIRQVGRARIAFIGAVTRATPAIVMPDRIRGWRFTAEAAALNHHARQLRAEGVDAIVAVVHEGGEADGGYNGCDNPRGPIFEIARALEPTIDVILSAHAHLAYNCTIDGRVVIQGASFGRLLSVIDLEIDSSSGSVIRQRIRARNVPVANGLGKDDAINFAYPPFVRAAGIAAMVERYRQQVAPLADRRVGRIAAPFERLPPEQGDSAAGRLIADAQRAATREHGAQLALVNAGGIRADLQPREPTGEVTYGDIFTMQPFGNSLVTMTLTGTQLKALLESQWRGNSSTPNFLQPSSTLAYAWREEAPPGARIIIPSITIEGRPWQPEAKYRVAVNSYLAAGGDRFRALVDGTDRVDGPLDVDALAAYLAERSLAAPLPVDAQPRIRRS